MPSHTDVLNDIGSKLRAHPDAAEPLYSAVCDVFECAEPPEILNRHGVVALLDVGLPPDQLLYILKWLFIEQDVSYWLQTGRDMLMGGIESKVFRLKV